MQVEHSALKSSLTGFLFERRNRKQGCGRESNPWAQREKKEKKWPPEGNMMLTLSRKGKGREEKGGKGRQQGNER